MAKRKRKLNKFPSYYLFIALFIFFTFFLVIHKTAANIKIIGDENVEINYNEKYIDKGATATFFWKNVSDKVVKSGEVDSSKVGKYEIKYTVRNYIFKRVKTRKVNVVDKKEPNLILKGNENIFVCPGSEYEEEGYEANDEYDGNLTDKVQVTQTEDKIEYTVSDSSNNSVTKIRKISKGTDKKPEIQLSGHENIVVNLDGKYEEPGFVATDGCKTDISSKVAVNGSIDTKKSGEYLLEYKVIDDYGNESTITRKVIVFDKNSSNGEGIGIVYLTFDDGPSEVTTPHILDVLKEEGVKATFFVTNGGPDELIKRMHEEGHTVALHTASHDYSKVYSSVDAYFEDLNLVSERVKRLTGVESKIIRFPGGSSNTISRRYNRGIMTTLTKEVVERGYKYYDRNVDSNDAGGAKSSNAVFTNVKNGLSKNKENIVLMHDIKETTKGAIKDIIVYGKNNGYVFEKIDMSTEMVTHGVNN